tara:strand:+ start:87 stop:776 length:690 start_codon:yes stop_codon:yes gene_type:complete
MKNIAIIPARGGSKRLPKKNFEKFFGKPLFLYSYESAIKSELFDKVIISTESNEILSLMKENNINDEYIRPKHLAQDDSSLIDVCIDVLNYYKNENFINMCLIWATSPIVNEEDLALSYKQLTENQVDGVVACTEYTHSSDLLVQQDDKLIKPLISYNEYNDCYASKNIFFDCGAFSWIKVEAFFSERNWVAKKAMPYILPYYKGVDLDTKGDLELLSFYYKKYVLKEA